MSDRSSAVRVGVLAIVAIGVLMAILLRLDVRIGLFDDRAHYKTRFRTIQGLSAGAEVRYKGVTVGEVEEVTFSEDPTEDDIVVDIAIDKKLRPRIDSHVRAELRTSGPLGNRLLELRREDVPPDAPLAEGAFIPSRQPFQAYEMLDDASDLFANVKSISKSLDVITTRLVAGEGLIGQLLQDRELGSRTLADVSQSLTRLRELLDAAASGKGMAGALLADDALAQEVVGSLRRTSASVDRMTQRMERGEGPMGQMLRDDSELAAALDDFSKSAASLREMTDKLSSSEGFVQRVLWDEQYGEAAARDLAATLEHLSSISAKLDAGQGTAGMLVNDPGIYENVNDIVRGVKKSWFINFILKRKHKKGFADRVDRIMRESADPDAELIQLMREVLETEEREAAPAPQTSALQAGAGDAATVDTRPDVHATPPASAEELQASASVEQPPMTSFARERRGPR